MIIVGDRFWKRTSRQDIVWQHGYLTELFQNQDVINADQADPSQQLPLGQQVSEQEKKEAMESDEKFAEMAGKLVEELRKFFRPELLNRFDEIIVFQPLTSEHLLAIVNIQLKSLATLLEEQNIGLEVTGPAREEIARLGYDPVYGARPLRRTLQRELENPISSLIIRSEIMPGDILLIDFDGNDFTFTAKKPVPVQQDIPPQEPKLQAEQPTPDGPDQAAAGSTQLSDQTDQAVLQGAPTQVDSSPVPTGQPNRSPLSDPTRIQGEVQCQACQHIFPGSPGTVCPHCGSTDTVATQPPQSRQTETPTNHGTAPQQAGDEDALLQDINNLAQQAPTQALPPSPQPDQPNQVQPSQQVADQQNQPTNQSPSVTPLAQFYSSDQSRPEPDQSGSTQRQSEES